MDGQIKMIDFGTATQIQLDEKLKRRSAVGTPWYCAPEVVNCEEYSSAVDVWSVGCSLLELLTGKPPYDDLNDIQCLFKMAEGVTPPLPTNVSESCLAFLRDCLAVDHTLRPTTDDLLNHPWLLEHVGQTFECGEVIGTHIQTMVQSKPAMD